MINPIVIIPVPQEEECLGGRERDYPLFKSALSVSIQACTMITESGAVPQTPLPPKKNPPADSFSHLCSCVLWISSANLSWKKLENSAYFTFRVNGNKIPQWMSADVFDTNSHFPICCLIEHDEWLESEKRRDKWQHLGSIACPIDSPSLLLLQPSWLLLPSSQAVSWGRDCFLEAQFMEKGRMALSYQTKAPCLAFVNI